MEQTNSTGLRMHIQFIPENHSAGDSSNHNLRKVFSSYQYDSTNTVYLHFFSRSFNEWWSILPFPYKIFIILIAVSVALVIGLYVKKWLSNNPDVSQSELNNTNKRSVPNPEYALPPSRSVLHLFKDGAVCSDAEICSKVGK